MKRTSLLYLLLLLTGYKGWCRQAPIAIPFHLDKPGYVTLVIENDKGVRVRNLVADTWYAAGDNKAYWDGLDDLGRDPDAARHGLYQVPGRFAEPGQYRVRGLVRGVIEPYYEFTTYTTGNPPWRRPVDHTGAWLANHTPPQAALFVPANQSPVNEPVVLLGCYITEGPDGLAWVDKNGTKRGGKAWIGGNWTSAPFLASDKGPQANKSIAAFVASAYETDKASGKAELRLNALIVKPNNNDYNVKQVALLPLGAMTRDESITEIGGFAVHNHLALVSLVRRGQVFVIDLAKGTLLDSMAIDNPRGLAIDASGHLLVLSGKRLLRLPQWNSATRLAAQQVITDKLEDPIALTFDAQQRMYISDRGQQHVIKIFDQQGKQLGSIGKPGVPAAGPYDPLHMNNPAGIAIDDQQQLWVTEADYLPKRVSVWNLDGKLINAFYGPPKYGGGGTLDAHDKNAFYYVEEARGGMEFALDWQKGTSRLKRIYYRPGANDLALAWRAAGPESPLYHEGKRYFTNCYNSSPTGGHTTAFLFQEKNGLAYPVAAMGKVIHWEVLNEERFKSSRLPGKEVFFCWSDRNGDAQVQPEEVTYLKGTSGGMTVQDDLSFVVSRLNDKAIRFAPVQFTKQGVPIYDLSKQTILATGVLPPASSGGDQVLTGSKGYSILTLGIAPFARQSISGTKDGQPVWSYPNLWPGLHASHTAPVSDLPGQLIGPTRLLGGMMPLNEEVGSLWAVNGNHGSVYVFTEDGLLVASLFEVMRKGKIWRMPEAKRNMKLDSLTLGEENFWPSLTKMEDGQFYLVDGARSALVRLDGLNNIHRLPTKELILTTADIEKSRAYQLSQEMARQQERKPTALAVSRLPQAPVVDGNTDEWSALPWVDIDKRGVKAYFNANNKPYDIAASAAIAGDRLFVAYRTGDEKLLQNTGEMPSALFKTGGALDLMIGVDAKADSNRKKPVAGDCRLVVSIVNKQPLALLYRAVVPGTPDKDKVPFTSPVSTVLFDKVEDVSRYVQLAGAAGNYELSIPLATLGWQPQAGTRLKGDIGILRGEMGETISRLYWSNKATGITADLPSEAMLTPQLWGSFEIK